MRTPCLAGWFPADPVEILQYGWRYLAIYYAVTAVFALLLWKLLKIWRFAYSKKGRAILSAVFAVIFAPSEVSDFFLFNLPGPAIIGLIFLLITLPFAQPTSPSGPSSAFLYWHTWTVIGIYYMLPLLVTFALAYALLSAYVRHYPVSSNV